MLSAFCILTPSPSLAQNSAGPISICIVSQDPLEAQPGVSNSVVYGDAAQPHVPTTMTDASGITWQISHNVFGQTTVITPPAGSPLGASSVTYDEAANSPTIGYPIRSTDGNGDIATFDAYDALGDLLQASTYPVNGNPNIRNSTIFQYDAAQRMTQMTLPDGKSIQNVYIGRVLDHSIGPDGTQYNYSYCGPCGALTGTSGPLNWSLGWAYDGDHDLSVFTDARIKQTHYVYGLAGELKQVVMPDGSTSSLLYDNSGRVRQATNGRNHAVSLIYDGLDRIQTVVPTAGQASIGYSYNVDDSIHQITDGIGSTTMAYLPNKWLSSVIYDYTASGLTAVQELDYSYFPDGSRQSLTWKSGGNVIGVWNYSYDVGGRLIGLTNSWNENTSWQYDGESKLTRQQNANGTRLDIGYNQQRGWPTSLNYTLNGGAPFASYNLTYDGGNNTVGNLTGIGEIDGSAVQYGYDALYRLTNEARTGTTPGSHSYGYDLAGNRTLFDGSAFSYDDANKLVSVPGQYGSNVSSDGDGNLTLVPPYSGQSAPGNFTWDDFGHLSSQTGYGGYGTVQYGYDGMGHRVWSQPSNQQSNIKTFYIFDGDLLLGEVKMQPGYSGNPPMQTLVPTPTAAYTWGADGLISERINNSGTDFTNGTSLWYAFGPQGETRQLTNGSGTVVDSYTYTSYGVNVSSTNNNPNPFRYGGQVGYYSDVNGGTGIILCTYRWYSPSLGRWISQDPLEYDGGDNLYRFCADDPVSFNDPSGLIPQGVATLPGEVSNTIINQINSCGLQRPGPGKYVKGVIILAGIEAGWELYRYAQTGRASGPFTKIGESIGKSLFPDEAELPPLPVPRRQPRGPRIRRPRVIMYHYTSKKGLDGILSSGYINGAFGDGKQHTAHGAGVYMTDIVPGSMSRGKIAYQCYSNGIRFANNVANWVKVDVTGLPTYHITEGKRDRIYLVPVFFISRERFRGHGETPR